jgi:Tfp pilus assembly protein PilF
MYLHHRALAAPLFFSRTRRILLALLLAAPTSLAATKAARAESPEVFTGQDGIPPTWTRALNDYSANPQENGPALLAIEREGGPDLPPLFKVALADAHLRAGQVPAAQKLLQDVLASDAGYPWNEFANLGLGATALMRGDDANAETYFTAVATSDQASARALGNLGLGHALVARGRPDEAREAFDAVAANTAVDAEFRQAGSFGSGLARYAAGDDEGAAKAFEELAASAPDGPLSRDARYAAARARIEAGDRESGVTALLELVAQCDEAERSGRTSRSLRRLDPRAVGRAWLRNYQRTPWLELQGHGSTMYSIGPCRLGRSMLRELEISELPPGVTKVSADLAARLSVAPGADAGGSHAARQARSADAAPRASASHWRIWAVGLAAIALVAVLWRWLSGRPRES